MINELEAEEEEAIKWQGEKNISADCWLIENRFWNASNHG